MSGVRHIVHSRGLWGQVGQGVVGEDSTATSVGGCVSVIVAVVL
jgi:hypothetical protein